MVQIKNIKDAVIQNMADRKIQILIHKNYIQTIKNSVNTKMFRNVFVLIDGKEKDITKNGKLSCAIYISSILKLFDLISKKHTTVNGTIKDMLNSGWKKTKKLKIGNVLVWEEKEDHQHVGFYIGNNKAISNSDKKRVPIIHHYTYNDTRKVIQILTYKIIK